MPDRSDLAEALAAHRPRLLAYCRYRGVHDDDADDLLAELAGKLLRAEAPREGYALPFLHRTLGRLVIDHARARARGPELVEPDPDAPDPDPPDGRPGPVDLAALAAELQAGLRRDAPRDALALLALARGESRAAVARACGITVGTLEHRLRAARARLREGPPGAL